MRRKWMGYIVLLLQHVIFSVRNACGLVAGRTIHTSRRTPGLRQESATCCLRKTWALKRSGSCTSSDEEEIPAKAVTAGAGALPPAPTTRGILTRLKERKTTIHEDGGSDNLVLYFAFGANMNPAVLTAKRGVNPLSSFPAEATKFATTSTGKDRTGAGAELCTCFCHRAGYATLAPKPGPPQSWEASPGAHGVVHAITSSDLKKIAASENGYRKRMVELETALGERDVAVCFVSDPSQTLPTSVPPTSRYLSLLQDGAAYHGVNERYSRWLEQLPSVPSEQEATSPERINTPSKLATDAVVTAVLVAALGTAVVALGGR